MSRIAAIALVWLAFAPAALASDQDEIALRHIKTVLWPHAYRTQDTELLDRLLHDSFEMIGADGTRSTKAAEIEWLTENPWTPGEFEYRIQRLDIYDGRVAIVDGVGIASEYRYASSNVLIKEDGRWRAVASHVSGFRPASEAP